jgi:lipopolysaccharide assembly outer membrane protein LptD (OstA)
LTARVELRSRLQRRIGSFSHVLEPRVGWALARSRGQSGNPLFVPETAVPQRRLRALDLGAVTGDDADRIPRANQLSFGVENRLYREGGGLVARLTLLALQDFEAHALRELIVDGEARGLGGVWTRFQAAYDPDRGRLQEGLARLGWEHDAGYRVSAGYRYRHDIPNPFENFAFADRFDDFRRIAHIDQFDAAFALQLTQNWLFAYRGAYSFDRDLLISNAARVEYGSSCGCWAAGVELSSDRAGGVSARVIYRISGFGRDERRGGAGLLDAP